MKFHSTNRRTDKKQGFVSTLLMGVFGAAVCVAASPKAFGERPSPEDREKFHTAMEACRTETGVTKPVKGSRPSEADRAKIDACLTGKGIVKPAGRPHGPGGRHGRPPEPPPEAPPKSTTEDAAPAAQ